MLGWVNLYVSEKIKDVFGPPCDRVRRAGITGICPDHFPGASFGSDLPTKCRNLPTEYANLPQEPNCADEIY